MALGAPAPVGNPLDTAAVAAEAGGEMRFGLLGWEALMAFPGLSGTPGGCSSGLTKEMGCEEPLTKYHSKHLPPRLACTWGKEAYKEEGR